MRSWLKLVILAAILAFACLLLPESIRRLPQGRAGSQTAMIRDRIAQVLSRFGLCSSPQKSAAERSVVQPPVIEKVVLERITHITPEAVVQKNIPTQTLNVYTDWVVKEVRTVLADSSQACELAVQVTLHHDDKPSFDLSAVRGKPETGLLHLLYQGLAGLDPLHTLSGDVVFQAFFIVNGGGPATPAAPQPPASPPSAAPKLDMDSLTQSCSVEIGMFCNMDKDKLSKLVRCLRRHSPDLLGSCRKLLRAAPGR